MSLINDAIKRAASAQPPPASSSTTQLQMKSVEINRGIRRSSIPVVVGLICAFLLGAFFVFKAWQTAVLDLPPRAPDNPVPVMAREIPAPTSDQATPSQIAAPRVEAPPPSDEIAPTGDGVGTETRSASTAVDPVLETAAEPLPQAAQSLAPVSPAPTFPDLKLQGIYYRAAKSSVVINRKTLFVGDTIQQARVVEITKNSATLLWQGETKVLTLE